MFTKMPDQNKMKNSLCYKIFYYIKRLIVCRVSCEYLTNHNNFNEFKISYVEPYKSIVINRFKLSHPIKSIKNTSYDAD